MIYPSRVKIVEVAPRDGLQAEKATIPVASRIQFINLLSDAGFNTIEVGSFVSPKWVPNMEESDKVYQGITKKEGINYSVLIPNLKGYETALENKVDSIAVFTAASETFCQKNINSSLKESLENFATFIPDAKKNGLWIRGYISCSIACPYEGFILPKKVHEVALTLLSMGCDEISLGDTIGVGTPQQVRELLKGIPVPLEKVAVHFHDTYGQGIANIYAALLEGVSIIDSSASGLGGCPYAPGASGNVATEDVIYLLQGLGIETGVDLSKLLKASFFIDHVLEKETFSKASKALRINKFNFHRSYFEK
ncbi:hydroxymethylglutaryl-CoA lyase [Geitlerinema splendidum]|jgi:hydroxymethylglutaryl-CoA lyase|nr:hydroxymethylglutaryl-CoA lyase [Geitlerinema splendidum]